jgi:hypothetical protein
MNYPIPKDAKIISINSDYSQSGNYNNLEGLHIVTDKGDIKILISDGQCCCEDAGSKFLETPDNIEKFIGSTILKIEDICVGLTAAEDDYGFDAGGETQLKVTTTKGVLQYAVYNSHNGYYSHATFVQVFDKIEEDYL